MYFVSINSCTLCQLIHVLYVKHYYPAKSTSWHANQSKTQISLRTSTVFAGHSMGSQRFNISSGGNLRLLSDYAYAQTDLNIHCMHMPTYILCCIPARFKNAVSYVNIQNLVATGDFHQCGMCNQQRLRSACAYAQSDLNLC